MYLQLTQMVKKKTNVQLIIDESRWRLCGCSLHDSLNFPVSCKIFKIKSWGEKSPTKLLMFSLQVAA